MKLVYTNLALQIYTLLDIKPNNYTVLGNTLTSMTKNDAFFNTSYEKINETFMYYGVIIFNNIILLHDNSMIDTILSRKSELEEMMNFLNNYTSNVDFDSMLFNQSVDNMKKIYEFLHIDFKININTMNYYNKYGNLLEQVKKSYSTDPQVAYDIINTLENINVDMSEVSIFINNNLEYWLYEDIPTTRISEVYYSILLAESFDVNYNKEKLIKFVKDTYDVSEEKIEDVYYLTKIYKALSSNENLTNIINKFKNNINNFSNSNIEETYYLLYLCKISSIDVNKVESLKAIQKLDLDSLIKESKYDKEVYLLYKISKILNKEIDINNYIEKIDTFYCKDKKGYTNEYGYNVINTYSTYRMLYILKDISPEEVNKKKEYIYGYLESVRGEYGGYFTNNNNEMQNYDKYKNNFTWEALYYAYSIINILD